MVELFQEMKTYYSDIRIERFVHNPWDLSPNEMETDKYQYLLCRSENFDLDLTQKKFIVVEKEKTEWDLTQN